MAKIIVEIQRCKGCGLCVVTCPKKIIQLSEKINEQGLRYAINTNEEKCIGCAFCAMICPDSAITVYK